MSTIPSPALNREEFKNFMDELIAIGGPEVFFRKTIDIYLYFLHPFYIYGSNPAVMDVLKQNFFAIYNNLSTDDERRDMVKALLLQIKNLIETTRDSRETIEVSQRRDAIPREIEEHIIELQDQRVLQDFEINDMIDNFQVSDIYPAAQRHEMKSKALWYFYQNKLRKEANMAVLPPEILNKLKQRYTTLYDNTLGEVKKDEFIRQLKLRKPDLNNASGGKKRRRKTKKNKKHKKSKKSLRRKGRMAYRN